MSQKQVADALDINQSTIAKIEINRNEATASTIRKLANFFGVSADYLLELEDDFGSRAEKSSTPQLSAEEWELVNRYRALNVANKKYLNQTIEILSDTPERQKKEITTFWHPKSS